MKILFVTNNYKPYSGGVVSSIEAFRYELKQQGHEVKVVTLDFLGDGIIEPDVLRLSCPIRFTYRNNPVAVPFFMRQQLDEIISEHAPDVIHTHHPFMLGSAAAKIAKEKNIPVIFTHHSQYGLYADHYAPVFKKMARSVIEQRVRIFCSLVDSIIVPTNSVKRQLLAQHVTTPLHVIPSGILPVYLWGEKPKKQKKGDTFELLTVSRFSPEKNIPFLLDVMTLLDDRFKLTLIGFGADYHFLKEYAFEKCKLSPDRVKFKERPAKTVIAQHYYQADAFVFASTTETQGLVFAESMAAGTPVVAVKAPGSQDCIYHGKNGFLVDTPEEMAEKITLLDQDAKLYQELHENAWETAQGYRISATAEQLLDLYQDLLS